MISLLQARDLDLLGLIWRPTSGDRFVIADRDMDDQVFVVSEMTIEAHHGGTTGAMLRFNGTTEWALDSVAQADVVWLPREDQLRTALGERFVRLEAAQGGFVVVARVGDTEVTCAHSDPERAYADALLETLRREHDGASGQDAAGWGP